MATARKPLVVLSLSMCVLSQASTPTTKPHIVYVLSDNLGYGGLGYLRAQTETGATREVSTPNIDALVESGIELARLYTYKFCSPSRCSLLSGRLPIHVNLHNADPLAPGFGIPEHMTTMPAMLKALGYRTHHGECMCVNMCEHE